MRRQSVPLALPRRQPARHIDGRPTRTNWLHTDACVVDGVEPAFVADPPLAPQPTHQSDTLVEPRRPLAETNAEGVELRLAVTQTDAENVVAAAQYIERGGFLGDMHRVERRQDQDVQHL